MLGSYLFNKITFSLNNGLDTVSEPDEGSYNHMSLSMMVNSSMMEATSLALML